MFNIPATVYALIAFMFVGSIIAVEARDLLSTVVSVSAVGAALSVIALVIGAPDIAITQVVVEVLCLVLLLGGGDALEELRRTVERVAVKP